jgi:hypothetical protein
MFNECRHIMPSGTRCKSPALKDKSFCYYHWRLRGVGSAKARPKKSLPLPSLEDPQGIQIALTQILGALGSSSLENKRAGLYLYGLQIATQLTARASVPAPGDVVRSLANDTAGGEPLAPKTVQCEPGAECDDCATRDECTLPRRIAYLDTRQSNARALKDLRKREFEIEEVEPISQALQWATEPRWEGPPNDGPEVDRESLDEPAFP